MRVALLGPVAVVDGERAVPVAGEKQRTLLALLALAAGEPVSADALVDELWPDAMPSDPTNALQARISAVRKVVGAERLRSTAAGYVLDVPADDVDACRFEQLVDAGRRALDDGDHAAAAARLDEAIGLWSGDVALADVPREGRVQLAAERLEDLLADAHEARIDADLALGRHERAATELRTLVARYPLRERLREQLMLALYRSGRQADALAAYQDARHAFADELGLDPGPSLSALEGAILRHDPSLLPGPGRAPDDPPSADELRRPRRRPRRRRRRARGRSARDRGRPGRRRQDAPRDRGRAARGCRGVVGRARQRRRRRRRAAGHRGRARHRRGAARRVDRRRGRCCSCSTTASRSSTPSRPSSRTCSVARPRCASSRRRARCSASAASGCGRSPVCPPRTRPRCSRRVRPRPPATPALASLCADLDGLPLAIELAAARTNVLSPAEIASRLGNRFSVLNDGGRTAAPRHQTLRALVDWSYELLFDDERRALAALSVFRNRFAMADAEAVCVAVGLDRDDVVDVVGRLVAKSLVIADRGSLGLLVTIRDYGAERLEALGLASEVRRAHARTSSTWRRRSARRCSAVTSSPPSTCSRRGTTTSPPRSTGARHRASTIPPWR